MADQDKEFLQKLRATFRVEAQEHLQEIVSNIVQLEQAGGTAQKDIVERILKKLHTLKGASRAVNLINLEMLCHVMESVFSSLAKSNQQLASGQFDLLHQAGSLAQTLLQEPSGRIRNQATALIARLEGLTAELSDGDCADAKPGSDAAEPEPVQAEMNEPEESESAPSHAWDAVQSDVIRVQSKNLDAIRYQAEALLSIELSLRHHIGDLLALADDIAGHHAQLHVMERDSGRADRKNHAAQKAEAAPATPRTRRMDEQAKGHALASDEYYNQLKLRCRNLAGTLSRTRRNFSVIRSKLMDATLETALVPFSSTLEQLPGIVRNLARSQGKEAVLSIEGGSVQVDRRVLETIREALIHLVTNAVDHGIEPVATRLAHGKHAAGAVRVAIAQCGGNRISITVADDGAGIDLAGVVASAGASGGLQAGQMTELSDQQKLHLILRSGVSTSPEITQVSGRGVGLAIVAEKVAAVGGELAIESSVGAGCLFRLELPVRLTTLRGLVLRIRGSRFVLPLAGIESVRALKTDDVQTVENRETLLVGKRVIPAIRLGHLLGLDRSRDQALVDEHIAVIVRTAGHTCALLIDDILAEQEVLPKGLGKQLRRVRYITGATQLGDGTLVPILGPEDIAKYGLAPSGGAVQEARQQAGVSQRKRILIAEDSITSRLLLKHILEGAGYRVETAVDGLDALSKLRHEEFDALVSDIEMPGLDGLGLTERIRADSKTAEMPVVLVTSLQSPDEKERGLRAGADAYVVKGSFDQDNLLAMIRRLI
jgi:two-component system chemotaxis sensor kinase CheA